jgi:hypothetical protein
MQRSLATIRGQRDGTLAKNERLKDRLNESWWDLWLAMWQVIAWAESWSESQAKLQCLRLHGPRCDLRGHWFAPWTEAVT